MSGFEDRARVASYGETAFRQVPGLADLHRMVAVLLAETAGPGARVLVLGAGGGLELLALAGAQPDWQFVGVDPSAPMLDQARDRLGPLMARVTLIEGLIGDAPEGPFDGATCLLTLHFLPRAERLATLAALRVRLRPGAALVVAHHSFDVHDPVWLRRYADFGRDPAVAPDVARTRAQAIAERLPVLTPAEDEALLHEAGFRDVALVYAGLTFRGWVARA